MARKLKEAIQQVPTYVEPRDCFVWFMNTRTGYGAIPGTPCAHYVAHQIDMTGDARQGAVCAKRYLLRVEDLVARLGEEIDVALVRPGDVWARLRRGRSASGGREPASHCGMVSAVAPGDGDPRITIKHCSSGQRRVAENDWTQHFRGGGSFYRLPQRAQSAATHANLQRLVRGFDYRAPFLPRA